MTLTARHVKDPIADAFGLAHGPAYVAMRDVVRGAGLIGPNGGRGFYTLGPRTLAECILAAVVAGSGVTSDMGRFLPGLRASGFADVLANLIELARAGEPEHLAESSLTVSADGAVRWSYVAHRNAESVTVEATDFGGEPTGRTFVLSGARLAEVLAGLAD